MWNKLSLRLKFLSLVIPLAIFTTFIFYVFVERQLSEDDNETLIGRIAELAEVQSRSISGPLWSFNIQQLQLVASSMINDPDVVGVDVLDETGASVASEGILNEASDEVFLEERAVFFNTNGTSREIGKLRVYYSKERLIDQAVARRLVALIATSLLICGLIFSALVGLYYTVLIPLGRFGEAIEKTRSSNIAVPVNWDTSDEMGTVARAFNDLQVQQKSDEAALRRIQDNLEDLVEKRTETLAQRETQLVRARDEAQGALEQLKRTQDRLIQSQKMASLGQLSAGIAHEIKNPLNFVNNFSVMSVEMLGELQEALRKFREAPSEELAGEIAELTEILEGNLEKIDRHGRRADNIVRNMLLHSREGPANFRLISVNQIVAEAVNLAFHSARAESDKFNVTIEDNLQKDLPETMCVPQDLSRVFINLASNAMYATNQRAKRDGDDYEPLLIMRSSLENDMIRIDIEDNGDGIAESDKETVFEPFFTSKPTGEGTGLGLSLAYDVVTKTHGGEIFFTTAPGAGTTFTVLLPLTLQEPHDEAD